MKRKLLVRVTLVCIAVIALMMVTAGGASPATSSGSTPWPGGIWQPDAPSFGMVVVSDVPIKMADGATLFANVGYPADLTTGQRAAGKFPVLLTQNPYAGASTQPDPFFVSRGYIFVSADIRGTGRSEGPNGAPVANELFGKIHTTDGVALVQWAAHELDGSNGTVGLTGCSFLGISQVFTAAAVGPHSPIKAIIPACASNGYYVYFAGGITSQEGAFLGGATGTILGARNLDANAAWGAPLAADIKAGVGDAYNNDFWQERDTSRVAAQIVRNGIPALLWSGWSATESPGPLEMYSIFQNAWSHRDPFAPMSAKQKVTGRYQLIVGPWSHGKGLDETIMLEWFDTWLKGQKTNMADTKTPLHLNELQSARWVNAATYPLVGTSTSYYLGAAGALTDKKPSSAGADTINWAQPTDAGSTLTYTSAPVSAATTIAGPVAATIYASSNNKNLELITTLDDVAADGTVKEITTGALLGSLRAVDKKRSWFDTKGAAVNPYHPFLVEDYAPPGQVERYDIGLRPTLWSVLPGHSLRLVLSTQTTPDDCAISLAALPQSRPCHLSATQQTTVPGGVYQIKFSTTSPSSINVPRLPTRSLSTARSDITATSKGETEPLQWDAG